MGSLINGEWQVSLNWSKNKAIEKWQNLVNLTNITRGLGDSSVCTDANGCVPINFFGSPEAIDDEQLNYIRGNAINRGNQRWHL